MLEFWDQTYAPHTGFGDDYRTSIKFSVENVQALGFPSWTGGPETTEHDHVNGDNLSIQYHGRRPWALDLRIWLENEYDLERLETLVGKTWATLRYRQGLTRRVGGTEEEITGIMYLTLPNTFLREVTAQEIFEDQSCEATLTFLREYITPTIPEVVPWPESPPYPGITWGYGSGRYGYGPYGYGEDDA